MRAGDRRDERADVRDDAEVALIKERLQFRQVRMEREIAAIAIQQSKWKQRGLRDGENPPRRRVGSVPGVIVRDDDVVRVIAAEKASTSNAFSTSNFSLSTGNLYSGAQPGGG